jgi:dolichyl-phosphate beta-glucosyltransferase
MSELNFSDKRHPGYQGTDPTKVKLSVVIPAYNEGKRIRPTLVDVDKYLEKQPYMYEIIVVDNGSTDDTAAVVAGYRNEVENSAAYVLPEPCPGKGCAVQRGIAKARGEYIVFMDADNATRITEMEKIWPKFEEGYDVVIGSRRIAGSKLSKKQPWVRETLGRLANLLIQILAVWGIKDTQCGFKAFTKKAARDIFSVVTIERWGFDIEVLALARKFGYKIAEVPVTWYHVETELIGGSSYTNTFSDLLKVWWNSLSGKYEKLREQSTERWRCLQAGQEPICKNKTR